MQSNINYTVKNNLCTGCGVCEDVCPTQSIKIIRIDGENRPKLNEFTCIAPKCGKCIKVCPGIGIDLKSESVKRFSSHDTKNDKYIGVYRSLYTGYSLNHEIRYHCASGGMVSQFLIYLLEKGIINGAAITGYSQDDKITPISYIARCKEDILEGKSSKYCPVSLNKIGNEIRNSEGSYVIVGLPCHIQGFRKRAKIDKKFNEKVLGYFSIYCSSNRTFNAQDFLLRRYHINKSSISYFSYRDNGCLGNLTINTTDKTVSVPYVNYYGKLRSFFKPRRCLTCIDHYGELADVCFGDIHIKPYSEDKIGISSWIVRNPYFNELFKEASKKGYIYMNELDAKTLNESQKVMLYPKKRKVSAVIAIDKMFGKKSPIYDIPGEKPGLKDFISVFVCHAQRFVGRHRVLWFLIEILYKRK